MKFIIKCDYYLNIAGKTTTVPDAGDPKIGRGYARELAGKAVMPSIRKKIVAAWGFPVSK